VVGSCWDVVREWLRCGQGVLRVWLVWSGSGYGVVEELLGCIQRIVEVWSGSGKGVVCEWLGVVWE